MSGHNDFRQVLPRYRLAGMLDEMDERVERPRGQLDGIAIPFEPALPRIEAKAAKFIDRSRHWGLSDLLAAAFL